jgi:hypothetical protein
MAVSCLFSCFKAITETPPINRYVAMVCLYFETGSIKPEKICLLGEYWLMRFDGRRCDNIDKDRTKHVDGNNITSSQSRTASGLLFNYLEQAVSFRALRYLKPRCKSYELVDRFHSSLIAFSC